MIVIRDAGWQFRPEKGDDGEPDALYACLARPGGWRDGLRVRSETEALGVRIRVADPWELVWERTGTVVEVVAALLCLPPPGHRLAPRLVIGTAPSVSERW